MYLDDRGSGFGTVTVSYWSQRQLQKAVQETTVGHFSMLTEGTSTSFVVPRTILQRSPFTSEEPPSQDEMRKRFRVMSAASSLTTQIAKVSFEWKSKTGQVEKQACLELNKRVRFTGNYLSAVFFVALTPPKYIIGQIGVLSAPWWESWGLPK